MTNAPCVTCPWRRSSTVGGFDIPGFKIDKMRRLVNTVGDEDAFRPIMACHYSEEGCDRHCIGYVAVEGYSNLAVRLAAIEGKIDFRVIAEECASIEMWPDFLTMLHAYEVAHASEED